MFSKLLFVMCVAHEIPCALAYSGKPTCAAKYPKKYQKQPATRKQDDRWQKI